MRPISLWKTLLGFFRLDSHASTNEEREGGVVPVSRGPEDRPLQVVIGLDFGTSFTKVILGESRARYPVPFDAHSSNDSPFLLPSCLYMLDDSDECVMGTVAQDGKCYDNLKMPLIERDFSMEHQVRAGAFLALVLRHARRWLLEAHSATYGSRTISWYINVGLPTDSYDDSELSDIYLRIIDAAWFVSSSDGPVTLTGVSKALTHGDSEAEREPKGRRLPLDRINAFPEFSAQVAGYVQSPRREDGLHCMVDVGGGTLDVTLFNIVESKGELRFPIFARTVESLGARYLMRSRLELLCENFRADYSPFERLPTDTEFCEKNEVDLGRLQKVDKPYKEKVRDAVRNQILHTKLKRCPEDPYWFKGSSQPQKYGAGVPAFYCGGGALAEFYSSLLGGFTVAEFPCKLRSLEIPVPDSLRSSEIDPFVYSRLAFAYGLSFDPYNIGEVNRMSAIPDQSLELAEPSYKSRYIGKDHV